MAERENPISANLFGDFCQQSLTDSSNEILESIMRIALLLIFAALFIFPSQNSLAQGTGDQPTRPKKQKGDDPTFLRWKIFLDGLTQEAKTVFPDERRPYAMADVANAYWEIDKEASRMQYVSALEKALSIFQQNKKNREPLNYVLSSATKRDANLAKDLNKRLLDDKAISEKDEVSSEVALDMLEENPEAAAQLAEAFAPNGLQDGSASFLIMKLAEKDIRLSDRVYRTYLNRVAVNENIPLETLINLGGYAFGHAEYYAVNKRGNLSGATLRPKARLAANPIFTTSFLNLAFRRVSQAIERRSRATDDEIGSMHYPILFALEYLLPEVARFAPSSLAAWQELQQQGVVGTLPEQHQKVQGYLLQIVQSRIRAQSFSDSSQTPEQNAEASLENVEKLSGTCQRDVVYSKAALTFGSRKNFKRALEIVKEIEDLKQSESVKQVIFINMASAAIENGDVNEAQERIDEISSPEHKAILHVRFLRAFVENQSRQASEMFVTKLVGDTEKLSKPGDRAGVLLSLSTVLLKANSGETQAVLRSAVRSLNGQEPSDHMKFSVALKVSLSCQGDNNTWYGSFETLPHSNIFEAFRVFANHGPDDTNRFAEEIGDKITKIRSQALIAQIALTNKRDRAQMAF